MPDIPNGDVMDGGLSNKEKADFEEAMERIKETRRFLLNLSNNEGRISVRINSVLQRLGGIQD